MYIYIIAFGNIEKRLLLSSSYVIKRTFGFDVRISSVSFPIKLAFNPYRNQYDAKVILERVSKFEFPNLLKLLVLVSFDIYVDGMNFVFGLAQLGGNVALVSTYRLYTDDEDLFFERTHKEIIHELGHSFGLRHCPDVRCVMSFSNSVLDVDKKSLSFCNNCQVLLKKLI